MSGPKDADARITQIPYQFVARPRDMVKSYGFQAISHSARIALDRIEEEIMSHGGNGNGKLIVTYDNFGEFGLGRRLVSAALRELDAIEIVDVLGHGPCRPNTFRLNYLGAAPCWKQFSSLAEARAFIADARRGDTRAKTDTTTRAKSEPPLGLKGELLNRQESIKEEIRGRSAREALAITRAEPIERPSAINETPSAPIARAGGLARSEIDVGKAASRAKKTPLPADYEVVFREAARQVALPPHWIEVELEKFRQKKKDYRSDDWLAECRIWCRQRSTWLEEDAAKAAKAKGTILPNGGHIDSRGIRWRPA